MFGIIVNFAGSHAPRQGPASKYFARESVRIGNLLKLAEANWLGIVSCKEPMLDLSNGANNGQCFIFCHLVLYAEPQSDHSDSKL